jgi:hypothetical protein
MIEAQDIFRALIAFIAAIQPILVLVFRDAFKRIDNLEKRLDDCLEFQRAVLRDRKKHGE